MDYTQVIGNTNELQCIIAFLQLGYQCSIPYGNSAKYDFIVDIGKTFIRIQCKSSRPVKVRGRTDYNAICFSTVASTTNTKQIQKHRYTTQDIDYFATCYNNKVYVIPVNQCSTSKILRFSPPLNGIKTYNKAEDFEVEKVFPPNKQFLDSKVKYLQRCSISPIKYYCPRCGKEVSTKGSLCEECSHIALRKAFRPDRKTLKDLIRTISFSELGKTYGVSDKTIVKWCNYYHLPSKKSIIDTLTNEQWSII